MIDFCTLGTGGAIPLPDRALSSLYVRLNGKSLLIDCGDHPARKRGKYAVPVLPDASRHAGEWVARYVLKTNPRRGGFVENITMDGVTAKKVTQDVIAVSSRVYYGMPGQEIAGPNPQLTRIEDVTMRNVRCDWAKRAVTLLCDPDYPARNFRLENVVVDDVFEKFATVENVDGIKLDVTAKRIHPDAHW